ncbi:MAG: hypothetical protein GY715_00365 [Planctomycetes bacterium]|nr:hypothetical protein [Planctomycetota bacterium]
MDTTRAGLLVFIVFLLTGCGSSEPQPAAAPDAGGAFATTAAPEYRRIHAALGNSFDEALSEAYGLGSVSPRTAGVLAARQPLLEDLVATSRIETCDFDTDYSQGPATLLPHLAEMRGMAKLLDADAYRLTAQMQRDAAAERLAAIVRMARHSAPKRQVLIENLVGIAILSLACETATELDDRNLMDRAGKEIVLAELRKLDPDNLLDARAALANERDVMIDTIQTGAGMREVHGDSWVFVTEAQKNEGVEDVRTVFAEVEAVWDEPTAVADIERITARYGGGKITDHIVLKLMMPRLSKYRTQVGRVSEQVRGTIGALE